MAFFTTKNWLNRVSQFPTRRRLTITSSSESEIVATVARDEGTVSQTGDAFSAANMNNLENRILTAFNSANTSINNVKALVKNSDDEYKTNKSYSTGDLVIQDNKVYRCTSPCSANTWANNSSHFTQDTLTNVINSLSGPNVSWEDYSRSGAVNFCKNNRVTGTYGELSYTVYDDGHVRVYASSYPVTLSSETVFTIWNNISSEEVKPFLGKRVRLTGCPSGGSTETYMIQAYRAGSQDGSTNTPADTGTGTTFTWLNDGTGIKSQIAIDFKAGYSLTHELIFYPMLTFADYDGPFIPFARTNEQLTQSTVGWGDLSRLGAVNYLNVTLTTTSPNLTFTVYSDKSVKISGSRTSTSYAHVELSNKANIVGLVPGRRYRYQSKLSGTYTGNISTILTFFDSNDETTVIYLGMEHKNFVVPSNAVKMQLSIGYYSFESTDGIMIYPMITELTYNGPYVPTTKTNKQLASELAAISPVVTGLANTIDSSKLDFVTAGNATYPLTITKKSISDALVLVFNGNQHLAFFANFPTNETSTAVTLYPLYGDISSLSASAVGTTMTISHSNSSARLWGATLIITATR